MQLVDTHCHIHDPEFAKKYATPISSILAAAHAAHVTQLICVGTDLASSRAAVEFTQKHPNTYASLAFHPHEAASMGKPEIAAAKQALAKLYKPASRIVAIGECGLDYYYHKDLAVMRRQAALFRAHIELAHELKLPMIFHVREAFSDFFRILDEYHGITGVVHSFSATETELAGVLERGLYVGLNGIMTFTKDEKQLAAAKAVPLSALLIETDAPFLTPKPFRGTMCEPKHVINITQFLSELRGESFDVVAEATTQNASKLFNL